MLTSYSRVTVVSGSRRVDIALPSALPIAEVVPQVLRFCAPDETPDAPTEMTLARVGGQSLSLSQSLAESGVHDGDVIELRSLAVQSRAAFVEDVRDSLEDAVDDAGGAWTPRSTVTFATVSLSVVLAVVFVEQLWEVAQATVLRPGVAPLDTMMGEVDVDGRDIANTAVATAVLLAATWVASRWAARWAVHVTSIATALAALFAGFDVARASTSDPYVLMTAGVAAVAAAGGASRLVTRRAIPLFVAASTWTVAAFAVLVLERADAPVGGVVRCLALVAVLAIGIVPRFSLAVGGLSSADYRVRNAGRLSDDALSTRLQESSGLLLGALYGITALVTVIAVGLAFMDWWDRAVSLSLAAALVLRSRVFSRTQHMLPLRLGALAVVVAQLVAEAFRTPDVDTWFVAIVSGVGLLAVAVSVVALSDITRARIKRLLNVVEFVVIVDLIVVTMGAIGLYDKFRN